MTMRNGMYPATLVASLAVLTASALVYADEGGVVQNLPMWCGPASRLERCACSRIRR
jgi:hypothetical protein